MVGIVIVTHGNLAGELIKAASLILGDIKAIAGVSIPPYEDMSVAEKRIEEAINKVESGAGVLVLTDLFGGTPSNLSLTFLADKKIEVLSGVNLPMLLSLATIRGEKTLDDVAQTAMNAGKKNITLASRILNMKVEGKQ